MRALLDTNILIYREAPVVVRQNIGHLFNWLDRLNYDKLVHPVSASEIEHHEDERGRESFATKIQSYRLLQVQADMHPDVQVLSEQVDITDNDRRDSRLLNELYANRADLIITEDRGMFRKAQTLGIADRLFTIDGFLEKAYSENPDLVDYDVLAVQKTLFGKVNVENPFFDSFREDYPGFDDWFNRKSEEPCYVCRSEGETVAFLYLKVEDENEPYHDITPRFPPARRLKIGTIKVELNGFRIGERFLKIVFDNAVIQNVDEIYVTIFPKSVEQDRLIRLLEDFGFAHHGTKNNPHGEEVYVRDMTPQFNSEQPRLSFPYVSRSTRHFLVPIYPEYHTELLPDSILNTESPEDYIENAPHRNAITKVYVSRSYFRDLEPGDIIVFYRTGGYYESVLTTLGIVEATHLNIPDEESFLRRCRKRSVFTNEQLREHWRFSSRNRPFVVEFLYAYSFPRRPNMAALIENDVIKDVKSAPRGFERITHEQFNTIIQLSETDTRFIVD